MNDEPLSLVLSRREWTRVLALLDAAYMATSRHGETPERVELRDLRERVLTLLAPKR